MPAPSRAEGCGTFRSPAGSRPGTQGAGYVHLCGLFLPGHGGAAAGVILNIIGMAGRAPRPGYICGGAGNAALIAFTSALARRRRAAGPRARHQPRGDAAPDRLTFQARNAAKLKFGDEERWAETLTDLPFGRPIEAGRDC
jgi:NAD(P)-dependent dehydrogenase (short-subunit alcohol dehydrogenase family)